MIVKGGCCAAGFFCIQTKNYNLFKRINISIQKNHTIKKTTLLCALCGGGGSPMLKTYTYMVFEKKKIRGFISRSSTR